MRSSKIEVFLRHFGDFRFPSPQEQEIQGHGQRHQSFIPSDDEDKNEGGDDGESRKRDEDDQEEQEEEQKQQNQGYDRGHRPRLALNPCASQFINGAQNSHAEQQCRGCGRYRGRGHGLGRHSAAHARSRGTGQRPLPLHPFLVGR